MPRLASIAPTLPLAKRGGTSLWLRLGLSLLLVGLVGWQVAGHHAAWATTARLFATHGWMGLLAAVALLPLNLGLEALKWRRLATAWAQSSLAAAWRAVLMGQLLGLVTPARLGEYPGRLWQVPAWARVTGGAAVALSRLGQLAAALLMTALLLTLLPADLRLPMALSNLTLAGIHVLVGLIVVGIVLHPNWAFLLIRKLLSGVKVARWIRNHLPARSPWSDRTLWGLLGLSALRHVVIILQLAVLIWAFSPAADLAKRSLAELTLTLSLSAALSFSLKAFLPTIALAELGVREAVAVAVALAMGLSTAAAFQATLALFLINLIVPSLIGLPLLLSALASEPSTSPDPASDAC